MGAPEDFEGLEAATGLTSRTLTQSLGYIYGDSRLLINGGFCPYHRLVEKCKISAIMKSRQHRKAGK